MSSRLDLFGGIRQQLGTTHNRSVFSGHETDSNTGLVSVGARFYDAALGLSWFGPRVGACRKGPCAETCGASL